MIVVDTSVWVDFFLKRATVQTQWIRQHADNPLAVTDLITAEILQGIRTDADHARTAALLSGLQSLGGVSREIAIASAEHYRWLRRHGITIRSTIDCLTATFCIREGHSLLHNDRDFHPFETYFDLRVVRP